MRAVRRQSAGQCYGNLAVYSLIVLWFKGARPSPLLRGERETGMCKFSRVLCTFGAEVFKVGTGLKQILLELLFSAPLLLWLVLLLHSHLQHLCFLLQLLIWSGCRRIIILIKLQRCEYGCVRLTDCCLHFNDVCS